MEISIGDFDSKTRTVPVTFVHEGVTHARPVNACFDAEGGYDDDATKARVDAVALGVANKIAVGVITNSPPAPDAAEAAQSTSPTK